VQPAETGGVLAPKDGLMGFAVVFEGPHGIPERGARGGHHSSFSGGGEDLVLAEAPGRHIAEAAHRLAMDARAVGLGAVFDHGDAVGTGEITDSWHVGGPAAEVHHGDGLGTGGDQRSNGGGSDRTRLRIHIGKHRLGTKQHAAGGSSDEGARGGDQLIARAQTDGQVGSGEG